MKILKLDLQAFGPFTQASLDLGQGRQGLHVICGPNEAGKSSILRALRAMFYGIPSRTKDDFLHPYGSLRIGARLVNRRGEVLEITRRKANQQSLRDGKDEAVVDEKRLAEFLGGVPQDLFETMFAIDHEALRRGGQEIASGNGSIGEILFAAGAGTSELRSLEQRLTSQCEALFKPKASKPVLNADLARLKELQSIVRKSRLPCEEWSRHDQARREAQDKLDELLQELSEQKRGRARLDRLRSAAPLALQRRRIADELSSLGNVVLLPDGFAARRQDAVTQLGIATQMCQSCERDEQRTQEMLSELPATLDLSDEMDAVTNLAQRLGSHRKAQHDVVQLHSEHRLLAQRIQSLLREIRPDLRITDLEKIQLQRRDRIEIRNLANESGNVLSKLAWAQEELAKICQRSEELQLQLGSAATLDPLDGRLATLRGLLDGGNPEESREQLAAEIEELRAQAEVELARLGWAGKLLELEKLKLPGSDVLEELTSTASDLERQNATLNKERADLDREIAKVHREIESLRLTGEVPTEKDLCQQREERDRGWNVVRQVWLARQERPDGLEELAPDGSAATLADAFEQRMHHVDRTADRLRQDASRVAQLGQLVARETSLQQARHDLERQQQEVAQLLSATKSHWRELWTKLGVKPGSSKEMAAFCRSQQDLVRQAAEIRRRQVNLKRLDSKCSRLRSELHDCLTELGMSAGDPSETLATLIRKGRAYLERVQTQQHLQRELVRNQSLQTPARDAVTQAEAALQKWKDAWAEKMVVLGLPQTATAAQANEALDQIADLFADVGKLQILEHRIEGIERDAKHFAQEVGRLWQKLFSGAPDLTVEVQATKLLDRLRQLESESQKRDDLAERLVEIQCRRQEAQDKILKLNASLEALCQEAQCDSFDDLPWAEQRSDQARQLRLSLLEVESQLALHANGASLQEIESQVAEIDLDTVQHDLNRLDERIQALESQRSDLERQVAVEENELSRMDGNAAAAEAADEIQSLLSRIASQAEQYSKLRLAAVILRKAVESYREKNQGPILRRASELFAELTLDSFTGIKPDYDEKGAPILVGLRDSGSPVTVDGMSDGTVDQLYLALRLASLELHYEKAEPLPFIIDDVLVNFDDDRALALLRVLAEFSRKGQVLFFTHHDHLVELAREHLPEDVLFVHELPGRVRREPSGYLFAST